MVFHNYNFTNLDNIIMTTIETTNTIVEQKESVKLMRMSKGYQWEIKVFIDLDMKTDRPDDKTVIERIKQIDEELRKTYIGDED